MSKALTVRPSTEVAFQGGTEEHVRELVDGAWAPRTLVEYAKQWRKFEAWCAANGYEALPAGVATLTKYISHMVSRDCAKSTLDQAFAAIRHEHRFRCAKGQMPDWEHIVLVKAMKGARKGISGKRAVKRAKPITREHMREAMEMLRPTVLREARDLAILALAYAGCRRRSEITGLDYAKRGEGSNATGYLEVAKEGLTIVLLRSKTNQDGEPKKFFINRKYFKRSCEAIEAWIKIANVAPGTPVLRGLSGGGYSPNPKSSGLPGVVYCETMKDKPHRAMASWRQKRHIGYFATPEEAAAARAAAAVEDGVILVDGLILGGRYSDGEINNRLKQRMFQVLCRLRLADTKRKKLRPEELEELWAEAKQFSGHSGRRGSLRDHFKYGGTRADASAMSGHVPGSAMLDHYSEDTDIQSHKFGAGSDL